MLEGWRYEEGEEGFCQFKMDRYGKGLVEFYDLRENVCPEYK